MDLKTLETLEFDRIRLQIAGLCQSAEGRQDLQNQEILTQNSDVIRLREEVDPFLSLVIRNPSLPFQEFPLLAPILAACAPDGAILDPRELKDVAIYCSGAAAAWKSFLSASDDPSLRVWALRLGDFSILADQLNRVIDSEGQIIEDAIPSLRRLKGEIAAGRREIDRSARDWLKAEGKTDFWQSDVPTEKDGRTVLALKSGYKGRLDGLVQGGSSSGATLYIEPFDLVEKNNRLAESQNALRAEILKLLKEWTAQVRSIRHDLETLRQNFTRMDTLLARARWGFQYKASFPEITKPGKPWKLIQARHPLLGEKAVPIDLSMDDGVFALLISGPNTGGKTVSLKTAGLLSLLNQFGVPVPCAPESILPVWDDIFTEIGDGQSLDSALSTFSGHMTRMKTILEKTTDFSLVLLDEMAGGTDPVEGGALGMVFLDHFLETKCHVLATTHHGVLKNYAYTKEGVKNSSVEFDEASGRPTYHILSDVPGSSYALETAMRVGIPESVIMKARKILEDGQTDTARIIRSLQDKQRELYTREREILEKENKFREEKRKSDLILLRVKQKELELKSQGLGEVNHFLSDSRRMFENLVKEIREGQLNAEKIKEVRAFFQDIEGKTKAQKELLELEEQEQALKEAEKDQKENSEVLEKSTLEIGDNVILEPGSQRGVLVRWEGKDRAVVSIGSVKMTVKKSSIRPTGRKKNQIVKPKADVSTYLETSEAPVFVLDLRGKRLEEALQLVESQVDRALLSGLSEFSILHGLGEGVLQKGVHEYLARRKEVQKYFFSHPDQGGFGKTIVQL